MDNLVSEQVNATTPEATPAQGAVDLAGFEDSGALATAYKSLQAEFTRRSQRLKQLEREVAKRVEITAEQIENEPAPIQKDAEGGESAVTDYEAFISQFPDADAEAVVKRAIEQGDFKAGGLTRQYVNGLKAEIDELKKQSSSEEALIERARNNGRVTEAIVREYLTAVATANQNAKPKVVGAAPVMPPARPRSIAEAGALANDIFSVKQ